MILRADIQPTKGGERRTIEVVCGSFEQGRAELDDQTPPGWRRLHIVIDRA